MVLSAVFDELDETMTNSSKVAAALGDERLVYLIDVALIHLRKEAIHTEDALFNSKRGPCTQNKSIKC